MRIFNLTLCCFCLFVCDVCDVCVCVQISELKLKLSSSGTQINYGAQELFIQQLKDEIERLTRVNHQLQLKARQQHHQLQREHEQQQQQHTMRAHETSFLHANNNNSGQGDGEGEGSWRAKLRMAAKYITQLIGEKEHLIEMSNKLRGELNRIKCTNCAFISMLFSLFNLKS